MPNMANITIYLGQDSLRKMARPSVSRRPVPEINNGDSGKDQLFSMTENASITSGSSPGRKRILKVVRTKSRKNTPEPKSVKHMYVTRKPKEEEVLTLASPTLDTFEFDSDDEPDIYARGSSGEVLKHSILGSVEDLRQMEQLMDAQSNEEEEEGQQGVPSFVSAIDSVDNRSPVSKTGRTTSFRRTPPRSTRSARGTGRGDRSVRHTSAPLERNTIPDPAIDREGYLAILEEHCQRANDVREKELAAEKELMEILPLDEKIALKREGMVLERWQKHLQEWDDVKTKLGNKIGRRKGKMVMDTAEEYRERTEEFDVLQMAIPPIDKQAQSFWMMNLRNNNERSERVGNVMTGLYCPVRERQHPPAIIRKPMTKHLNSIAEAKKASGSSHSMSSLEGGREGVDSHQMPKWKSSEYFTAMKKKLKKRLPNVRPHDVTEQEAGDLTVEMPGLFEWALNSSKEYFQRLDDVEKGQQQTLEYSATLTEDNFPSGAGSFCNLGSPTNTYAGTEFDVMSRQAETVLGGATTLAGGGKVKSRGPCLEVGPSTHLLFESTLNTLVQTTLVLRNTGSTAIFYSLVKKPRPTPLTATYHAHERERVVPEMHPSFNCHDTHGMILPDAQHTIIFSFKVDHTGLFSEGWLLRLTPKVHVSYEPEERLEDDDSHTPTRRRTTTGSIPLFLQGSCSVEDTNEHKRAELREALEKGSWALKVREIVAEIVREVRTPRREEVILRRERQAFESINFWHGLYYDKERYEALHDLFKKVRAYLVEVKWNALLEGGGGDEEGTDEEEWLPSKWNSSVNLIRQGLESIVSASNKQSLVSIEPTSILALPPPPPPILTAKEKKGECQRRQLEGLPLEDQEKQQPAIDPVVQTVVDFSNDLRVLQLESAIRPTPHPEWAAREALAGLADAIEHAFVQARESNGMTLELCIPPAPSPFTSESGAAAWETIMTASIAAANAAAAAAAAAEAQAAVETKAKSPTKKDGKTTKKLSQSNLLAGPTQLQMDKYHYDFYANLYNEVGNMVESLTATALKEDADYAYDYRLRTSLTVTAKGAFRPEDVEGQCVVLYVDLDISSQMVYDEEQQAWTFPEKERRAKNGPFTTALGSIRAILACGPTSLIILSRLVQPRNGREDVPFISFSTVAGQLAEAIDAPITFLSYLSNSQSFKRGLSEGGIYFVERIESESLVTPRTPPPTSQSDDEEERLPTFEDEVSKRRRIKREQKEKRAALEMDVGKALSDVADLVIIDDPQGCLDEKSPLFNLKSTSGWVLAGPILHNDLNTASFFAESAVGPKLAVVGGLNLAERIPLIDVLIDTVDALFLGGAIAINFLYASGMAVGAAERVVDKGLLPIVRKLLNKAQRSSVKFVLPIDAVVGEAGVSRLMAEEPKTEVEDQEEEEEEENDDDGDGEEEEEEEGQEKEEREKREEEQQVDDGAEGRAANDIGEEFSVMPPAQEVEEEENPAAGFDYEYTTTEVAFEQGIPTKQFILDVGPQSSKLLQDLIQESSTILWDGVIGAAECSAFQTGTRALVSSLVQAHDESAKVVIVNGGTTGKWARLFSDLGEEDETETSQQHKEGEGEDTAVAQQQQEEEDPDEIALEKVKCFSHIFHESKLMRRVLATIPVPMVESLLDRTPYEEEVLLYEELRVREIERLVAEKERRALEEERQEEEEEEQDEEEEEKEEDAKGGNEMSF